MHVTKELMNKKKMERTQIVHANVPNSIRTDKVQVQKQKQKHISHIIDYNLISIVNVETSKIKHDREERLRELESQNYRLIQSNYNLMVWSKDLVKLIKQSLLKAIGFIEQFSYLDGVTQMYQIFNQIADYQQNYLPIDNEKNLKIQVDYLRKTSFNPQSKNYIAQELKRLDICSKVINWRIEGLIQNEIQNKLEKGIKQIRRNQDSKNEVDRKIYRNQDSFDNQIYKFLFLQGLALENLISERQYKK